MKSLWLIGESMPLKEDGSPRRAYVSGTLQDKLVPLDPRHGVFPNFVMKPLFAAGYVVYQKDSTQLLGFFNEVSHVVADSSERRFNLFGDRITKPKKRTPEPVQDDSADFDTFVYENDRLSQRIKSFDYQNDLWLVFGHQTIFGLLNWLVDSTLPASVEKKDLKVFSSRFQKHVLDASPTSGCDKNNQLSSKVGLLHRLCTAKDARLLLQNVIERLGTNYRYPPEDITHILRSTIPFLHNEGYQDGQNPTGNAQAWFVKHATGKFFGGDLYWQVMGNAIAARMLNTFVDIGVTKGE